MAIFGIVVVDIISRSALVGFILLCASKYYYRKGLVCYVLLFYNQYIYGELSILILFILSQDTPTEVRLLLLYSDLQKNMLFCYVLFLIITELFFSRKFRINSF